MAELEEQIAEQIAAVEESLTNVDEVFGNLSTIEYDEIIKKMSPLDRAKYDLTNLYAINSLFWMYTKSFGEDPKTQPIKEELDRIRQQMMRVKEICDKSKMPRINKEVAQRMVKHELWDPKKSKSKETAEENWDTSNNVTDEPMETDNKSRGKKRKFVPTNMEDANLEPSTSTNKNKPTDEDEESEQDEPSVSDDD